VRIAVIGDYNPQFRSHVATDNALEHAAAKLSINLRTNWLPTPSLLTNAEQVLKTYDGLWISAGSPYQSMEGALKAIEFARVQDWPLVAT
jgi:CTP synthase (UTP-ammonia lyase)